jgi:CheY-like chemotaxis protein
MKVRIDVVKLFVDRSLSRWLGFVLDMQSAGARDGFIGDLEAVGWVIHLPMGPLIFLGCTLIVMRHAAGSSDGFCRPIKMFSTVEPTVLLVEDNPIDVLMLRRAFTELETACRLSVVSDGAEAIQYLNGEGAFADRKEFPIPNLILLDLGLPHVDGFQVLQWLRAHATLRHLPVIVLSGSSFSPDIKRAYAAGANSFLTKPSGLAEVTGAIKELMAYWLERCRLMDSSAAAASDPVQLRPSESGNSADRPRNAAPPR